MKRKDQVRELWKISFDDTDEFVDLYMRLRYQEDISLTLHDEANRVISALQMIPYYMTFGGEQIPMSYISGASTHPDYRGKGLMKELLLQSFTRMRQNNITLSTLIPAEPWLFDYYKRLGYAAVFAYTEHKKNIGDIHSEHTHTVISSNSFDEKVYRYLTVKMAERPCCVQHTADDFRIILEDLALSLGTVLCTYNDGQVTGMALAFAEGDTLIVNEIFADNTNLEDNILLYGCNLYNCKSVLIKSPADGKQSQLLGMARIIDSQVVLGIYAAHYPEKKMAIKLTDNDIPDNNGFYYVKDGSCVRTGSIDNGYQEYTIAELTEAIFMPEKPYMSLMLN